MFKAGGGYCGASLGSMWNNLSKLELLVRHHEQICSVVRIGVTVFGLKEGEGLKLSWFRLWDCSRKRSNTSDCNEAGQLRSNYKAKLFGPCPS
jgi:hypothetical protein